MEKRSLNPYLFGAIIFTLSLSTAGYAGTWRDNFEAEKLEGWTRPAADAGNPWEAIWKTQDGHLDVTFNIPRVFPPEPVADFLQLTAFPIRANSVSVTGTFRRREIRLGEFGIALGKPSPSGEWGYGFFYVFTMSTVMEPIKLDKNGEMRPFKLLEPQHRFPLEQIKVIFSNSHFEVFHDGVSVLEFEDVSFRWIEMVGFWAQGFHRFHGVGDDFVISGPGIPTGGI